jgi:hypothetical protein
MGTTGVSVGSFSNCGKMDFAAQAGKEPTWTSNRGLVKQNDPGPNPFAWTTKIRN